MSSCVHNIRPSRGNTHQAGSAKHRARHFLKCVVELIDQNGFASVHFCISLGLPNFGLWRFARTASWIMHSLLSLVVASHACPVPSPEDSVAPALRLRHMVFVARGLRHRWPGVRSMHLVPIPSKQFSWRNARKVGADEYGFHFACVLHVEVNPPFQPAGLSSANTAVSREICFLDRPFEDNRRTLCPSWVASRASLLLQCRIYCQEGTHSTSCSRGLPDFILCLGLDLFETKGLAVDVPWVARPR